MAQNKEKQFGGQNSVAPIARSRVVSNTFWNAIGSVSGSLGRFAASVCIARLLGPALAGEYAYCTWIAEFGAIVFAIGIPGTLTRHVAMLEGSGQEKFIFSTILYIRKIFVIPLLTGGIALALWMDLTGFTRREKLGQYLILALYLGQMVSVLISSQLIGLQRQKSLARANIASGLVLVLGQPLAAYTFGLNGALACAAAAMLLQGAWLSQCTKDLPSAGQPAVLEGFWRNALFTWLSALVSALVWSRSEIYFLNHYSSADQAGYFTAGLTAFSLINLIVVVLTGALVPHFSFALGQKSSAIISRDYRGFTTFVAFITIPCALVGASLMPQLMTIVFGSHYSGAAPAAALLMCCASLSFANVGSSLVYAAGGAPFIFFWGLLGAVLLVTSAYFVAPGYGAIGVAAVKLAVQTLMVAGGTVYLYAKIRVTLPLKSLLAILISAAAAAAAANVLVRIVGNLAVAIGASIAVYFCLTAMLRPLEKEMVVAVVAALNELPAKWGGVSARALKTIFRIDP